MPLSFSNLLSNPLSSALNNKKSVSPYKSLTQPAPVYNSLSPVYPTSKPTGSITGTNLNDAVNNLNVATTKATAPSPFSVKTAYAQTTDQSTQSPAPTNQSNPLDSDTYKNLLISNIQGQIAEKQNQLKTKEAEAAKAEESPVGGLFGQLVGKGQENLSEAAKVGGEAGKLRQLIQNTKQNVMGNPNYSGTVKIGQAGLVDQNLGTQLQGLAAEQEALSGVGQSYLEAAGNVKPIVSSFGQTAFNPATGEFSGGNSNLDPETAATQLAQKVSTGQMTYDQAVSSLGYAGSAGQQFLNNAIKKANPNFNIPQSTATIQGQQGVANQVVGMQAANNAAKGIENTITGFLNQNPDLNPSKLAAGNVIQQWIQGKQLTDPKYQTLFNYINEYISTLAPILGVGGDTTNLKTEIAQSFINAQASGASISEVLKSISSLADQKIKNFQSGAGVGANQTSGVGNSTSNSGSGGLFNW